MRVRVGVGVGVGVRVRVGVGVGRGRGTWAWDVPLAVGARLLVLIHRWPVSIVPSCASRGSNREGHVHHDVTSGRPVYVQRNGLASRRLK